MADEGQCSSLGGLPWAPGAPWLVHRGPRVAPGGEPVSVRVAMPLGEQMVLLAPCLLFLFSLLEPACRAGAQLLGPPQSQAQGRDG